VLVISIFVLSETMEDIFIDLNDTRISKLFRPFLTQLQGNTMVYLVNAAANFGSLANFFGWN
jgi:hypothetical protein